MQDAKTTDKDFNHEITFTIACPFCQWSTANQDKRLVDTRYDTHLNTAH